MTVGMRKAFAKSEMDVKVKKNRKYFLYCLKCEIFIKHIDDEYYLYKCLGTK